MKIAVVGGAGYIGSHVCKALLAAGHRVLVYDNLSSGLQQNLLEGCEFQRGDVLEQRLLCETLSRFGAQAAIHLAAFKAAGESMTAPAKYSQNNIAGSISLVNACLE